MLNILKTVPPQIIAYLVSFLVSVISGKLLIPLLKRLKFGQIEREEGPESHKIKQGTPTMGGIIFFSRFYYLELFTASLILEFYPWSL